MDFFLDNLGDVSDQHGERFHQDISNIETRYQGKPNDKIMGDYCWYLQRETDVSYRHKQKVKNIFEQIYGGLCLSEQ